MSLVEPRTPSELSAHYKAVRARLWSPILRPPSPEPVYNPPIQQWPVEPPILEHDLSVAGVAARWRDIDDRLFGTRVSPKAVIDVTAAYFGLPVNVVCGRSRKGGITKARQSAMYIMHSLCRQVRTCGRRVGLVRFSLPQIGHHFCVNHSTVYHSIGCVRVRMAKDEWYATAISEIMALLQRGEKK